MEIQKINQQYLRINAKEEKDTGEVRYCKRILQKNDVKGLLMLNRRCIDGELFYQYTVEGLHSMEDVFDGGYFEKEDMNIFVRCLSETLHGLTDFLLKQEKIYFDPAYIMFDGVTREWKFLYLIEDYRQQGQDIVRLLDFFLNKLRADAEKESWFYEYYTQMLQFGDNISPSELVNMWEKGEQRQEREEESENRDFLAEKEENCIADKPLCEHAVSQERAPMEDMDEPVMDNLTQRWNYLLYSRLYAVPFQPGH